MSEIFDIDVQQVIRSVCQDIADFLVEKNNAYGNSALEPARIFARADTKEQLYVRIDDKLNRIMRGHEYPGDDTIDDLLGYLILLKVYERIERARKASEEAGRQESGQENCEENCCEENCKEVGSEKDFFGYTEDDAEKIRKALQGAFRRANGEGGTVVNLTGPTRYPHLGLGSEEEGPTS